VAGVIVTVAISGGGSVFGDFEDLLNDSGMELVVVPGPGACGPCRANKNPRNVPCAECDGNVAGHHMESAHARAVGNLCRCRVEMRRKTDRNGP
jgi:hypothetical protein